MCKYCSRTGVSRDFPGNTVFRICASKARAVCVSCKIPHAMRCGQKQNETGVSKLFSIKGWIANSLILKVSVTLTQLSQL